MNKEDVSNVAWIIKYRPKSLGNVVGDEAKTIKRYIDSGNIPHLLLVSRKPGLGKTTIAKALINDLKADSLEINGSDERGIDTIRDKIKQFISTKSSNGNKKIVMLDEMDSMTRVSQEALRNMMESYAKNAIFVLTANYENKIIEPLKNRCSVFRFGELDKEEIKNYLIKICVDEDIKYTEDGLNKLIDVNYPSIRAMINDLQRFSILGWEITVDKVKTDNEVNRVLWGKLFEDDVDFVRKEILSKGLDVEGIIKDWFELVFSSGLHFSKVAKLSRIFSDIVYRISVGADKNVVFIASLYDMYKIIKGE